MNSPQVLPQQRVEFGQRGAGGAPLILVLAIVLFAAPSKGEEAWQVRVDCPELDAEARAQLEVRHLVELQGLPGAPKTMVLACGAETLEGRWERSGEVLSRRSVTRTPNDDVLELAHWMASVLIGVGSEADPAQTGEVVVERPERKPEEPPPPAPASEPKPQPKPVESKAEPPPPAAAPPVAKSSGSKAASRADWELGLGVGYRHYGTQVAGSLGPVAQGIWHVAPRVGVGGAVGYRWGVDSAQGVSVDEGALAVHAGVQILNWLGVLAGPSAALVSFRGSEAIGGGREQALTFGGELLIRAETPNAGWGGFVAVGVSALLPQQEVLLDGEPALELPILSGGVILGLRYENRK